MPKTKSKPKQVSPRTLYGQSLIIGDYHLVRTLNPEGVWITNPLGEAMMTSSAKLESVIARFFQKEF